ncbi:unnamed protein product [Rotaria sp. Silwood1]|nr:unnamed protein product [Rotaria sp. Silwood1]
MSSPAKTTRTPTLTSLPPSSNIVVGDAQDDFQAFQMRPVIRDFKLAAELFASNGDIVLICGRSKEERQGMLLVSYEIPSAIASITASIRLVKVIRLTKKSVTQLETIPILKIALLLGDGTVSLLDIDSLVEIATVSNNSITLFSTWYDIGSNQSTSSSSSSNVSISIPTELQLCAAIRRRSLVFYSWLPQQKVFKENKDLRGAFDLIDAPRALALSREKICIGYRKSYVIMSLTTGMIINELTFSMTHDPVINCLQDRTQWCIQMESNTVFLNSSFEPLYENGITWKDIPSGIVQASPYVLALMNQSIDVCTFNGSQSVPVQQIPHKGAIGKCRLWMDARTERIYTATPTDVTILEPIPVHIQLQNYTGRYRYDLALILIRAVLGISVSSSTPEQSRTIDGHGKGKIDTSTMPKQVTFENDEQSSNKSSANTPITRQSSVINEPTRNNQKLSDTELWTEYYRVGTMNAFQLFHKQQFEQAFAEFNDFLTDPGEIISLFAPLSANVWLTNSYNELNSFVKQHRHFAEPNDFVGVKFENALHELQRYLTDLRRVFQTVFRRSPDSWLEVQSLVQNRLILKPVRELLSIVETALLKAYLIDNNNILANALLRNQDNCCLPSEVEKELKKHHRRQELVSFYEKRKRHSEALDLITNTETLSTRENILNYLSKLDNDQLPLIFKYIEPMIKSALEETNNENILHDILILFVGEATPASPSPSTMDISNTGAIKLNPIEVYGFLKDINQDFAIKYLETICLKPELGSKQRDIHNRLVYAYCDRIKQLSNEFKPMIKAKQQEIKIKQQPEIYEDNDVLATQSTFSRPSSSVNVENYSAISSIKKQKTEYETKLKFFLLNQNCQCDFDKLEAYFLQEQNDTSNEHLFSLHYAIVLGKLGQHESALETFVKNGFYTDAENYCETIYSNGKIQLAHDLYRRLIEFYLKKSNDGNLNENSLKTILRIVNNASERLDPVQTLEILPGQLKLNNLKDFIEHALQTCSTNKRSSQLERNLLFLKLLRTQSNRISSENHSFVIDADSTCARTECTQPFTSTQAVMDFEEFIESLESLPIDLSRNLRLLRELDDKSLSLKSECSTIATKYQQTKSHDEKYNLIQTLNDLQSRRLLHANEKITLANQAYEMVEKHIRRLDDVLEELAAQPQINSTTNRKKKRTISTNDDINSNKKRRKIDKPLNQVQNKTSIKKKEQQSQELTKVEPVGLDLFPIDPYEPRYCICNQVSFGRMIACDNPHCQIEWFHFACVKLEEEPKGKWFCEKCRSISN